MAEFFAIVGTVALSGVLVLVLMAAGWSLAIQQLHVERRRQRTQRDLLDAEWRALDRVRQVRDVFLVTRRAMQRLADDDHRQGGGEA